MESSESLSGLSKTALGMARVRAAESRRPDRLFDDPYASAFVGTFPEEQVITGGLSSLGAAFFFHGAIRTRFFDDHLLAATAAGCRQVVLLAAGLDTRAFRLAWPDGVRLFEVDLPEILGVKERVLAEQKAVPRCRRTVVPADLRADWPAAVIAEGFQPARTTAPSPRDSGHGGIHQPVEGRPRRRRIPMADPARVEGRAPRPRRGCRRLWSCRASRLTRRLPHRRPRSRAASSPPSAVQRGNARHRPRSGDRTADSRRRSEDRPSLGCWLDRRGWSGEGRCAPYGFQELR
jgi:Leucine carboxyl methyltransferase